jgi:uncharacterized protein (DUF58 family)
MSSPEDPTRVRFDPGFVRRLEHLVERLVPRGELAGARGRTVGAGDEVVGYRPYRPGEELRHLDWNLLARLDRPFVRVHRRESGERWAILLDASASMGLGTPGKLQLAAEVATGLAFCGLRSGAVTRLFVDGSEGARSTGLRRRGDLARWMSFLAELHAGGERGVRRLLAEPRLRAAERVFVLGDLFDSKPGDVLALARPGVDVHALQLLAQRELDPPGDAGVRWLDPETGESLDVAVDAGVRASYERALDRRLETWRATFARHRAFHGCWSNRTPFEDIVRGVVG